MPRIFESFVSSCQRSFAATTNIFQWRSGDNIFTDLKIIIIIIIMAGPKERQEM